MPKSIKSKSCRKALSNISNCPNLTSRRKNILKEAQEAQKNVTDVADASLDRLHVVHASLARLINEIDGLVARAHKVNLANKLDVCDLECFIEVLSRTHLTLQEWVPKFEQPFGHCSVTVKKQTVPSSPAVSSSIACDENLFPLDEFANSLPPSPLVAWPFGTKGDCEKELFLLTPMPKSRPTCTDSIVFPASEVIASVKKGELASMEAVSIQQMEAVSLQQMEAVTPQIAKKLLWKGTQNFEGKLPNFEKEDTLKILSTPGLEISPPKTCALLRPMSELSEQGQDDSTVSTPPPTVRIPTFDESPSDDLELQIPKSLRIKYPYLFKNEAEDSLPVTPVQTSPRFTVSPPKSCVLLLPSNELLSDDVPESHKVNERDKALPLSDCPPRFSLSENLTKAGEHEKTIEKKILTKEGLKAEHLGSSSDTLLYSTLSSKMMQTKGGKNKSPEPSETRSELGLVHLNKNILSDSASSSFTMPRSTQLSKIDTKNVLNKEKTGKQPGEETLRRELWSKLKAESADRPSIGTSAYPTARKDFLYELDKASAEDNSFTNDELQTSSLAKPNPLKDEGSSGYRSFALTRSTARVPLTETIQSTGDGSHKTGDVAVLDTMKRLQVGRLSRFLQNKGFGKAAERQVKY